MTLHEEDTELNIFPVVGMQNSALVLKDEDGDSVTDLEELTNFNDQQLTPAAINVENSSDVIIGPVTQFHGPVTIYQNVAGSTNRLPEKETSNSNGFLNDTGKLVKSESTSSDIVPQPVSSEKPSKNLPYSKHLKYIGCSLVIVIIIAIITTATILLLSSNNKKDLPQPKPNNNKIPDDDNVLKPAGPGLIIEKKDWGGRPALNWTKPLSHPTPFVIISHSVTPQCHDFDACSKRVQSIQAGHVSSGKSPDIGYNFIIGGDGNAYVGRGWDIQNFHKNNSIGICFIGNYVYDYLTPDMYDIAKKLLDDGVKTEKLSQDYILVGHNQTFATESPGPHIYEVIKTWSHFNPQRYL